MKNVLKRALAIFLTIVMTIGIAPLSGFVGLEAKAATDNGTCGNGVSWSFDSENGHLVIGGTGEMNDFASESEVPWSEYRSDILSVAIGKGVSEIGKYSFYNCENLKSVTITEGVISIGDYAFENCVSLENVVIPDGVVMLGTKTFYGCSKLVSVTLNDDLTNIGMSSFENCTSLESVSIPGTVTSISLSAFKNCTLLASLTIEDGVTEINDEAFMNCSALENISISDSISSMGKDVFYNSGYYENTENWENDILYINNHLIKAKTTVSGSFVVKEDTKTIAKYAFSDCSNLETVSLSDGIKVLPDYTFNNCTGLKTVTTGSALEFVGDYVFSNCINLETVTLSDNVRSIGEYAFSDCKNLTSVYLGNSLIELGEFAFRKCSKLTSITLPESIKKIYAWAFFECTGLVDVYFAGDIVSWCNIVFRDDLSNPMYYAKNLYFDGILQKNMVIPDTISEIKETIFYSVESLETVVIPDSVKVIGEGAFANCTNLISVTMGNGVEIIEKDAFNGCTRLDDVTFSENLVTIGEKAFFSCVISEITLPDSVQVIGKGAFSNCDFTSVIIPDSVTDIGVSAFASCTKLLTVTIGSGVKNIGSSAFLCMSLTRIVVDEENPYFCSDESGALYNKTKTELIYYPPCSAQTNYVIPESITDIAANSFADNKVLVSLVIPDTVKTIGSRAFSYCTNLSSITISDNVTEIGYKAFDQTAYYKNANNWKDGVLYIGNHLIEAKTTLAGEYVIKPEVKTIAHSAFYGCSKLTSVILPDGISDISNSIFKQCTGLTSIDIPDSVTKIDEWAFASCKNLVSVTIPDTVKVIGSQAFRYCEKLASVDLPESLVYIGFEAFALCLNLTEVVIPENVVTIDEYAFSKCKKMTYIEISESVETIGTLAFEECIAIKNIKVDENNRYYSSDKFGVLYNKSKTELLLYPVANERTTFTVPDTVKVIGAYSFYSARLLEDIIIPSSVVDIKEFAFYENESLKKLNLPDSITTIEQYSFYYCMSLKDLKIPDSVTEIGGAAFAACIGLENVTLSKNLKNIGPVAFGSCINLRSVEIPESVESIGETAFVYCNVLEKVTMHSGALKNIDNLAFMECLELSDVYFYGSEADWNKVAVNGDNSCLLNAKFHFIIRIVDDETDVGIEYEDGIYDGEVDLDVDKIPDDGQIMLTNDQKEKTNAVIYDISTLKDGMTVQPNGKIKVRIPAPENYTNSKIFVFYIDHTINDREWIPARIIDGYVVFEVDHFSLYAVADLEFTFSLDKTTATVTDKNKTVKLSPVIESEITINGYTVQWMSNDEAVATVDENGVVTRVGDGECTITAIFNEDTTKLAECKITSVSEVETEPDPEPVVGIVDILKPLRGTASMKSYKGEEYVAITMASGRTMTGLYKDMVDGGTIELVDICGTIQNRANDYVAYQSQNKTNPVATMKVTYADGTVETYPVVFELYEMEREIDFDPTTKVRPIRGNASLAEDAKGEYILVEMVDGQSSVGVYKSTTDGSTTATLDGAEGMFTEQEKLYIFYGSQNTTNPEGRLTVTEADGSQKTYRIVFKMYEMDPYVNVAKGLRPVRGAVTFDADGTIRIKMTSGQKSVGLYKTMVNGATFKIVDANGRITNNPSSIMFYMSANTANVTATMIFTFPDGTTKEQKIIFDMGLEDNPDPLVYLSAVRGIVSYQNDGVEDYIEVKANALSSGVGLNKECLVKYTITDVEGIMTENNTRYYIYKSQNPDGLTANINFLQSDGSYKTYKVKFVF